MHYYLDSDFPYRIDATREKIFSKSSLYKSVRQAWHE
jgi:hypothetical protein